jgi:hypothetical protein
MDARIAHVGPPAHDLYWRAGAPSKVIGRLQ